MIITIIKEKFLVDSKKYYSEIKKPQLLSYLNQIIEWDLCAFPIMADENGNSAENRAFLGDEPKLSPGDMFVYQNQVIAVQSPDSVVLPIIRTGIKGLQRVWDDFIQPEISMYLRPVDGLEIIEKEVINSIPTEDTIYNTAPYSLYKLWRSKYGESFKNPKGKISLKLKVRSEILCLNFTAYMGEWGINYSDNKNLYTEELMEMLTKDIITWFFENEERTVFPANEKTPFESASAENIIQSGQAIDLNNLPGGITQVAPHKP